MVSFWHFARSTDPQKIPAAAHQISRSADQQAAQIRAAGPDQRSSCKLAQQIQTSAQQRAQIRAADQLKTCIFLIVLKRRFFAFFLNFRII